MKQCVNCFKTREEGAEFKSNASHFCNALACQHVRLEALGQTNEKRYKKSQDENIKRKQEELKSAPQRNKKRGRPPKNPSGRKCQKCGKDPSPNYFYCPPCHKEVSKGSTDGNPHV